MKYGLIGNPLGHSISPQIHALLGLPGYELAEIPPEALDAFFDQKEYAGFNVTIPYKEAVIPFLKEVKEEAREIGAVNTVVWEKDGYVGYNTDADGMTYALKQAGIDLRDKNVVILGTGGTSKTAQFVAKRADAKTITVVGRTSETNYTNVYDRQDTEIIINTTPVGMFPHPNETPLDLTIFPRLSGVFDVIYNPTPTRLIQQAATLGVPCANGLLMLVEQARRAEEIFLRKPLPPSLTDRVAAALHF